MSSFLNSTVFLENLRVGLEGDERAGRFALADDLQLLDRLAPLELHAVDLAVAGNLHLEPFRDRVDALRADAVGAAGKDVAALAVLAAGVERGQDHLDAGNLVLGMNVDRDAATLVPDGDGAVDVDVHLDAVAVAGQMLVDGVVEHLRNAMVQGPLVGAADVHARLFPDRFETLQLAQFGGIVFAVRHARIELHISSPPSFWAAFLGSAIRG